MSVKEEFIQSLRVSDEFEACREVVRRHFGPDLDLKADLMQLAKSKGISVIERHDTPFEGMIERDGDGNATITLRPGRNQARSRFTLAHELGHWLLQEEMIGTMKGQLFRGISRNPFELREEERLASLVAAEILMPFKPIEASYDASEKSRSIKFICQHFGVSQTAAMRRIADVCNTNLLLLQVVPYIFDRPDSAAQIDDAIFATGRKGTLFARERTKLAKKISFLDLLNNDRKQLSLKTPKGDVDEVFELDYRPTPIPHVLALTNISSWNN